MKKFLVLAAILLLPAICGRSQNTAGAAIEKDAVITIKQKEKEIFKNYFNLTLQTSFPLGDFGTDYSSYDEFLEGYAGMGTGYGFNIGTTFYLRQVDLSGIGFNNKFEPAVEVTYISFVFHHNDEIEGYIEASSSSVFGSIKAGPSLSFNPSGRWIIAAKLTLEPTFYYSNHEEWGSPDFYDIYAFLLRTATGVYARYKPFILSFDVSFGSRKNVDTDGYHPDYNDIDAQVTTTRFDIILGFSF